MKSHLLSGLSIYNSLKGLYVNIIFTIELLVLPACNLNTLREICSALSNANHSVDYEKKRGLAKSNGCYIQLAKKAQQYIFSNIRAFYFGKIGLAARIERFAEDTRRN